MKQEELQAIASQLKHPTGEKGIEMGNMMNETNINMTKHSIQNLNISNENRILELGHGNAGHVEFLFEQAEKLKYYGLEMSELMFQEARQINRNFVSQKQAFFSLYDGNTIPFEEELFDKIFTVNTIYFWQNPEELLAEIYRVLKPNGIFVILETSVPEKFPFKQGYAFHSKVLLPLIGKLFSKDKTAYSYLSDSANEFPFGEALNNILRKIGFIDVKHLPQTFGVATIYQASKK